MLLSTFILNVVFYSTFFRVRHDATIKCVDKLKADGTDGAEGTNGQQTHTGDPAMGGDALG